MNSQTTSLVRNITLILLDPKSINLPKENLEISRPGRKCANYQRFALVECAKLET